jgi:hypothetical protein
LIQFGTYVGGEQKRAHGISRDSNINWFDEDQPACLRKGLRSLTFNLVLNFVNDALESISFGMTKQNRETKINEGGRVGVEGEDIEDGGRDGVGGIFAEYDGGFEGIDRLSKPPAILVKIGLDVASFPERGFPKN